MASVNGCHHCDPCSEIRIELPALQADVESPLTATFVQGDADAATITCSWGVWSWSRERQWNCAQGSEDLATRRDFYFRVSSGTTPWTVTLSSGSEQQTFTRAMQPADFTPEAWPGSCTCDDHVVELTADDLALIGVVPDSGQAGAGPGGAGGQGG